MKLYSSFASSSPEDGSVSITTSSSETTAPEPPSNIDMSVSPSNTTDPSDSVWNHRYHGCRHQFHRGGIDQGKLEKAHQVADVIGKRNFEGRILASSPTTGVGYGIMIGGATFVALGIPAMIMARPLGYLVGRHTARIGMKLATAVAAGTIATRYVSRYQTLQDLKIMGTYISPNEKSASADAVSQHPLILQALRDRQDQQQSKEKTAAAAASKSNALLEEWKHHHDGTSGPSSSAARNSFWWGPSLDRQILGEYDNVLLHCQERNHHLTLQAGAQDQNNTAAGGKRRHGPW